MTRRIWMLGLAVLAGACGFFWYDSVHGWRAASDPGDALGLEFRFLGCDDWPQGRAYEPVIRSEVAGPGVVYRVSDPATCGYSVRRPRYRLVGDTLALTYDLYTPSGEVAACICGYNSEFRFRKNPKASRAMFDHSGG